MSTSVDLSDVELALVIRAVCKTLNAACVAADGLRRAQYMTAADAIQDEVNEYILLESKLQAVREART